MLMIVASVCLRGNAFVEKAVHRQQAGITGSTASSEHGCKAAR